MKNMPPTRVGPSSTLLAGSPQYSTFEKEVMNNCLCPKFKGAFNYSRCMPALFFFPFVVARPTEVQVRRGGCRACTWLLTV